MGKRGVRRSDASGERGTSPRTNATASNATTNTASPTGFFSGAIAGAVVVLAVLKSAGVLTWPGAPHDTPGTTGWSSSSAKGASTGHSRGASGRDGSSSSSSDAHADHMGGRDRARDAERVAEILAENRALRRTNPVGARDQLRMLLAASPLLPPASDARRRVFDALADTHAHLRNHSEAYTAHTQSATIVEQWVAAERARSGGGVSVRLVHEQIVARVQMATDLYLSFRFDEALALTADALSMEPPPAARRVLHKLESTVFECKGDFVSALQRFEEALRHAGPENGAADIEETKQHLDLLKRVASGPGVPDEIRGMMRAEQRRLETSLVAPRGPFTSAHQLPRHFHQGLTALPWHDMTNTPDPAVPPAFALLKGAHASLVKEFNNLNGTGKLLREQECIHDTDAGVWRRYEVTGVWRPLDPLSGCSEETPVACGVLSRLRGLGLRVLRAGYSAVGPSAWLKPHHGMSNGQLKLHLGLIVPDGVGHPSRCATIRVGNTTRGWEEGGVLYFDDSFEHEVHNACDAERVVFQVVFVHFDLRGDASPKTVFAPRE